MLSIKKMFSNYKKKKNVGCSNFQILLLSLKINKLQKHLSLFKKDFHSRVGLLKLIFHRRKILKYIKNDNFKDYIFLKNKLNLRN